MDRRNQNATARPVTFACPLQTIVMHKEHDTLYAVDPACRNFSLSILKLMIGIVLENMPGGAAASLLTL